LTLQPANSREQPALITRCVSGDEQAWCDLHRQYYPVAFGFLRRMGVPSSELDDACQEVFVQILRYLPRFEQRADFSTWLYKLCLSQANRFHRRQRLREALDWLFRPHPTMRETAVVPMWSGSPLSLQVMEALAKMNPLHKTVLVLYEFEGLPGEEIARILGCPPATVRRRLHYARQEFETLLREDAPEDVT
jgi:RNA polymerase sigma-70 factor (ECF subfamily)